MATKELKTIIQLRRASDSVYSAIEGFIPRDGEVLFVETNNDGLRCKIGDGETLYSNLGFFDAFIVRGYYYNGEFYANTSHTEKYVAYSTKLYIDITDNVRQSTYIYDGSHYTRVGYVPDYATDTVAGIMKLYINNGQNIDGTMTQKAITNAIDSIKLGIDASDTECLVLARPW